MEVDQPRAQPGPAGIDDLMAVRLRLGSDREHGVSLDDHRALLDPRWSQDSCVSNDDHPLLSSASAMTAIRTGTPLAT
jgi:hypothetical protein